MSKLILVAEDDVMVRNMIVKILSNGEYGVLEACSAVAAVHLSDGFDGTIDLLIANESLRTTRACEVFEGLQQSRPDLKILQISGYPLQEVQRASAVIPGAEFLQKPFVPKLLLERVRQILEPTSKSQLSAHGIFWTQWLHPLRTR